MHSPGLRRAGQHAKFEMHSGAVLAGCLGFQTLQSNVDGLTCWCFYRCWCFHSYNKCLSAYNTCLSRMDVSVNIYIYIYWRYNEFACEYVHVYIMRTHLITSDDRIDDEADADRGVPGHCRKLGDVWGNVVWGVGLSCSRFIVMFRQRLHVCCDDHSKQIEY